MHIFFSPRFAAQGRLRFNKMSREPLRMQLSSFSNRLSLLRGPAWFFVDYEIGTLLVPNISVNRNRGSG
jgi:hypothetical protein